MTSASRSASRFDASYETSDIYFSMCAHKNHYAHCETPYMVLGYTYLVGHLGTEAISHTTISHYC